MSATTCHRWSTSNAAGSGSASATGTALGVVVGVDPGDLGERLGPTVQLPGAERAAGDREHDHEREVARPSSETEEAPLAHGSAPVAASGSSIARRTPRPGRGTTAPRGSRAGTRRARRTRATSSMRSSVWMRGFASRCARRRAHGTPRASTCRAAASAPMPPITRHRARRAAAPRLAVGMPRRRRHRRRPPVGTGSGVVDSAGGTSGPSPCDPAGSAGESWAPGHPVAAPGVAATGRSRWRAPRRRRGGRSRRRRRPRATSPGRRAWRRCRATRIDIAIEYLIMRDRRSASGEGGSVVIDCCFMVVAVGRAALLSLKPTSV